MMFLRNGGLYMKNDNKDLFLDDNETEQELLLKDMTIKEIDEEYERIFGNN